MVRHADVKTPVYLDHGATTPVHPLVKIKVAEWLEIYGNPSSIHWSGRGPKAVIREARQNLAKLLGVSALELIFTGGGSEANNLALKGLATAKATRKQILISVVEHPSVRKTAEALRDEGFDVRMIRVNRDGQLDLNHLREMAGPQTLLVSVMLANNETGHIQPIPDVVAIAKAAGALVHTDAVQALGKIPLNLRELGVDMATISGHKFYALKGTGALFVRRGLNLQSLIHGGPQERGRRAGTENVLGIASLGEMAKLGDQIAPQAERIARLRDRFEKRLLAAVADVRVLGPAFPRIATTTSLMIAGVDGETLLMNLDVRGFAVSTGAACSSGSPEPSPTLLAMGLQREEAQTSLRVSLGWETTEEQMDRFHAALVEVIGRLRGFSHGERQAYGV
ncbi:MAG TPA: cysteine desulfurase family protein [Bdellovibrionales bacterium]|nr:cysteine desulfurase family protein [Bdellovibrionales bacterium]